MVIELCPITFRTDFRVYLFRRSSIFVPCVLLANIKTKMVCLPFAYYIKRYSFAKSRVFFVSLPTAKINVHFQKKGYFLRPGVNITLKVDFCSTAFAHGMDDVSRVGPLGQPWYTTFRKQGKQENSLRFCTCTLSTRCICFFYLYHRCAVLQLRCFCNDMLMGN